MKFQDIDLVELTAGTAKERYENMTNEEITHEVLDNVNDAYWRMHFSHDTKSLAYALSFYLLNSDDTKNAKIEVARAFTQVFETLDAISANADGLNVAGLVSERLMNS